MCFVQKIKCSVVVLSCFTEENMQIKVANESIV